MTDKHINRAVYSYLLQTYGHVPQYWMGMTLVIVQTLLLRIISPFIIAHLVTQLVANDHNGALWSALWYLIIGLAGLVVRMARDVIAVRAENIEYGRQSLIYYQKIVNKDVGFFRDHQTGYIASTFRQNVDSGLDLVRLWRAEIIQTLISLAVPPIVLLFASWPVGLAALGVVIAQLMYVYWVSSKVNADRTKTHEIYRKISGLFSDDVTNIIAYKTSGSPKRAVTRMQDLVGQEVELFWRRRKHLALFDMPRDLITVTGTAIALWLIITNANSSGTPVGLVVLTITYMFQIFQNVASVPDIITKHDDLVTRLYPTLEYLSDKYETIRDPHKPKSFKVTHGAIDLQHVAFAYTTEKGDKVPVFSDLTLHINGGEQVGVVGLSGAGKSTLASLLMRFDDVTGGAIKIDGTDLRDVRQSELRSNIAYVPQEPLLFHRSIRENLQFFGGDVSEEHMIRAAKAAHVDEFIQKLPHGYDTIVGERGIKLSGGQKQRVVIARAILKNAPIMVFDEATSALDSESEKIIQKALPQILGKRSALVIAHRLSTIANLDRIIVMHDGTIAEQGTHAELLKLKGRYYSLWQKQTAQE